MIDFSKVKHAVSSWFKKLKNQSAISGCKHTRQFKEQVWARVGTRKYKLQNRHVCSDCNISELKDINGE